MAKMKSELKFPNRKISDTLLQFTEPLLDALAPNVTEAQMEQPLMIAWTVWNAAVYADIAGNSRILENVCASMGHDARLKGFVETLIHRKRTLFGDDHRLIGEYKLFRLDGEIRLRAEARDPRSRNPKVEAMPTKKASKTSKPRTAKKSGGKLQARCGLCGNTKNLTKTECCGNWICDDEHTYVLFSYARNSCSRNHRRYTLCGLHFNEGHEGDWKDCPKCRDSVKTEMYVYYGTNEYNFEVLPNPPAYEPTKCSDCGKVIALATEGHSILGDKYWCDRCSAKRIRERR